MVLRISPVTAFCPSELAASSLQDLAAVEWLVKRGRLKPVVLQRFPLERVNHTVKTNANIPAAAALGGFTLNSAGVLVSATGRT